MNNEKDVGVAVISDWGDLGDCDSCGRKNIPVVYKPDPYIDEVYPEDHPESEWWCEDCYDSRHADV